MKSCNFVVVWLDHCPHIQIIQLNITMKLAVCTKNALN